MQQQYLPTSTQLGLLLGPSSVGASFHVTKVGALLGSGPLGEEGVWPLLPLYAPPPQFPAGPKASRASLASSHSRLLATQALLQKPV